jgi:transcriptional regulator with XRE-family HTH domain
MNINNKEIGKRISNIREAAGLNKKELAELVHVAASTISRYEDGSIAKIKIPVISAIANVLEINPMWIIGKSEIKDINNGCIKESGDLIIDGNRSKPFQKLSSEERSIINKYRALDERGKFNVRETIDREYAFVRPDSKGARSLKQRLACAGIKIVK